MLDYIILILSFSIIIMVFIIDNLYKKLKSCREDIDTTSERVSMARHGFQERLRVAVSEIDSEVDTIAQTVADLTSAIQEEKIHYINAQAEKVIEKKIISTLLPRLEELEKQNALVWQNIVDLTESQRQSNNTRRNENDILTHEIHTIRTHVVKKTGPIEQ